MIQFEVFTVFPELLTPYLSGSMLGRAQLAGLVRVEVHDLRDFTTDRHRTTDDAPYGGGGGMIMKPEPLFAAVRAVLGDSLKSVPVILLSPQGRPLTPAIARPLAAAGRIALLCGRYEGVDARVESHLATDQISIGDYVLTGGELPALVVIDAVSRFVPGVLGEAGAAESDSHSDGLLEYPQYTRPPEFEGLEVPEVLLSGDHARIRAWRRRMAIERTHERRPDLLARAALSEEDREVVAKLVRQSAGPRDA
jgi:tRNA (guanine37-N1)-methyltransferase